jgi:diguanylate cyclase (GGDEF)-like protein
MGPHVHGFPKGHRAMQGLQARWLRWVEESPYLLTVGVMLACVPLLVLAAWVFATRWAEDGAADLMARANLSLEQRQMQVAQDFDVALNQLIGLPEVLSGEPRLLAALARPKDVQTINTANRLLANIARFWVVELAYLMDANGVALAANNFETPKTLVGQSFADRDYFRVALRGQPSHQFAIGRVTGTPGLYFTYPVRQGDKVLGVVAIKADVAEIGRRIRLGGCLVVDDLGVVVLSDWKEFLFNALPNAAVLRASAQARQQVYQRTEFPLLHLAPAGRPQQPLVEALGPRDNLVLRRQVAIAEEGMTVHVMEDLDGLAVLDTQRQWLFLGAAGGAVVVVWALVMTSIFVLRARLYRRHILRANRELRSLNAQFKQQAESDFLTGCMNRRRFSEVLGQEMARSRRYAHPLVIALFDLDHFKRINDSHGHAVGDVVLQRFAELVRGNIRVSDSFARLGGEEFAVLLPDTEATVAMPFLERVRTLVAQTHVEHAGVSLQVTVSTGATGLGAADDSDSFLRRADDALYTAKTQGRNRVVFVPFALAEPAALATP